MSVSVRPDAPVRSGLLICTALQAILLSFSIFLTINFTGILTPQERLLSVALEANQKHQLDQQTNWFNDMFSECMVFYMEIIRDQNKLLDIVSSRLEQPASHPCDGVRKWLGSAHPTFHGWVETRRFYGVRHIYSDLVRYFSIAQIRSGYFVLSVFAPLVLAGAFILRSKLDFFVIFPFIMSMLVGFSIDNLGGNIAHAPGWFIPTLGVSWIIIYRDSLVTLQRRFFVYTLLACLTTYFDLLHGPLPFIMTTTIIVNHMLYHSHGRPIKDRQWIFEAAGIIALFSMAAVSITLLKMLVAVPFVDHNVFSEIKHLGHRLSSTSGGMNSNPINRFEAIERLWNYRYIYFSGSNVAATAYYVFAGIAWFLVLVSFLFDTISGRIFRHLHAVLILFLCAGLIMGWYLLFTNHSYVHAHFMGRLGIIPASTGIMALIYYCGSYWHLLFFRILGTIAVLSVPIVYIMTLVYPAVAIIPKTILRDRVDVVSCSGDPGLAPDGKPDLVIQFEVKGWSESLVFGQMGLRLERINPPGFYTGVIGAYPIAVLDDRNEPVYNERFAKFSEIRVPQVLVLAICLDGFETVETRYRLVFDLVDPNSVSEYFGLNNLQ